MTRQDLINAVKVKLEELTPFAEGLMVLSEESDVKPINSYIDATLDEASDEMLMLMPLHLLAPTAIPGAMTGVDGVGYLTLPSDYLRLHGLRVDTWAREITRPISIDNPEYALQGNPHTRGKSQKPVVVLNGSTLECYSVEGATPTVTKQNYVKRVSAEANPSNLKVYVIYLCAIKVTAILGDAVSAKTLAEQLGELLKLQAI